MNQDEMKREVASAALDYIVPGAVLGVGTGSTVNHLIDLLRTRAQDIAGAVSSSEASTARLKSIGIPVFDLNDVNEIPIYIDGADEVTVEGYMIKGGGGALTREKIVARASDSIVCIVDELKLVETLGRFPLPIEVIPAARALVSRQMAAKGGVAKLREGFRTDNGNLILDIHGLEIRDPMAYETAMNQLAGVVSVGIFAQDKARAVLVSGPTGVKTIQVNN